MFFILILGLVFSLHWAKEAKMDELIELLPQLVTGAKKQNDVSASLASSLNLHGLSPLAAYRSFNNEDLAKVRYQAAAQYLARQSLLNELDSLFQIAGIEAVLLKGASVAERYWPEANLRPSCDLDLLLREEDKDKANEVFTKLGYVLAVETPSGQKWKASSMGKPPLDIAYSLRAARAVNPTYQIETSAVFNDSVRLNEDSVLRVMDPYNQLLHCAVHAADHAFSRLLWLADLAFICETEKSLLSQDQLFNIASQTKASRALRLALSLAFGLFLPHRVNEIATPPWGTKWLVKRISNAPSQWGDQFITPKLRTMLRACLVDRPEDLLRAFVGLPAK